MLSRFQLICAVFRRLRPSKIVIQPVFVQQHAFEPDFGRFLREIWNFDLDLRRPRTTSSGQISVTWSSTDSWPNAIFHFPIPFLGKIPGRISQKSHFHNGITISRPFLY